MPVPVSTTAQITVVGPEASGLTACAPAMSFGAKMPHEMNTRQS